MSRKIMILAVLSLSLVWLGAVGSVGAQITDPVPTAPAPAPVPVTPRPCYVAKYDMNGDKRVNDVDFNQWKRWFLGPECQQGAGVCPPQMDTNGDGKITFEDLDVMLQHYVFCVRMPWSNDLPPR